VRLPILVLSAFVLLCPFAHGQTPEEARLAKAIAAMPGRADAFDTLTKAFAVQWRSAEDAKTTLALTQDYGHKLWQAAKTRAVQQQDNDDRPLYWGRLALTQVIHDTRPHFPIFPADREAALKALEQASRGMDEVAFPADRSVLRILITGFDPFLLDRDIGQSNPSGVGVLALDGTELNFVDTHGQQRRAHIEAVVFPVRFADFDAGIVEDFLQPWMAGAQSGPHDWFEAERQRRSGKLANVEHAQPQVDMVVTTSMGRDHFELERFTDLRRSSPAPDNLNAYSGGSLEHPALPSLRARPLQGSEFIEFSLPSKAMRQVQTPYAVDDDRWVRTTTSALFAAGDIGTLYGKTSVEGSGGGYLSNEVSYRALRLRDELGLKNFPVGHLHLPAITGYDAEKLQVIITELRAILAAGAAATNP
jgi:hypothetical protein